jgi:hypothetical protein
MSRCLNMHPSLFLTICLSYPDFFMIDQHKIAVFLLILWLPSPVDYSACLTDQLGERPGSMDDGGPAKTLMFLESAAKIYI